MNEYSFAFSADINLAMLIIAISLIIYSWFLMRAKPFPAYVEAEASLDLEEQFLPNDRIKFNLSAEGNHFLTGLMYEGKRIPEISIVNRELFIDGKFKRKLAKTSKVYNRGNGIFVDGKYVN
jgi:hypothetical protein